MTILRDEHIIGGNTEDGRRSAHYDFKGEMPCKRFAKGSGGMLKLRHILFLSSAAIGIGAVISLSSGLGQLALKLHTSSSLLIGIIIGLVWFAGVILPPIIGTRSDNTRTKYGRRIPYLAIFIPLTAVMLLFVSFFVAATTVEVSSAGNNSDYFVKVTSAAPNEEGGYTLNLSIICGHCIHFRCGPSHCFLSASCVDSY